MAISPVYALRETGQNLWRNFMLSMATVITIGVSLWLFGGFFLFNYAVDNATQRWEGGIEFVVWMNPEATSEQNANILDAIMTSPEIQDYTFVDQDAAYEEFKDIFSDTPELVEVVTPEVMPPSWATGSPGYDVRGQLGRVMMSQEPERDQQCQQAN